MTRQQIDDLDHRIRKEIDAAVADAEARPLPKGKTALEGVYCEADCWWGESRIQDSEFGSQESGVRSQESKKEEPKPTV
jgi:TPP-dependent pyruvate/acetoin dehydrogenase alpha subunit